LGIDKYRDKLHVFFQRNSDEIHTIVFCDITGEELESVQIEKGKTELTLYFKDHPTLRNTVSAFLHHQEKKCSKNAYANDIEYLHKGNPSRENQRLQKLVSSIMPGNMNEFEIYNHLSAIMKHKTSDDRLVSRYKSSEEVKKSQVSISYEESKTRLELEKKQEDMLFSSAKKLLDAINAITQITKQEKEKQAMDQDETGNEDGGQDMGFDPVKSIYAKSKTFSSQKAFERQQKKVLTLYNGYMQSLAEETYLLKLPITDKRISYEELSYFIVLYLQLLHIANKVYEIKDQENRPFPILVESSTMSHEASFTSISLRLIGHILLYLYTYNFKEYEDDYSKEYLARNREQLALLINFGLVVHYHLLPSHGGWIASLYKNAKQTLPPVAYQQLMLVSDKLPDILEIISTLDRINDSNENHFMKLSEVGYVSIEEYIPSQEGVKSLKISFPGLVNDQKTKDFDYPKLYLIEQEKWLHIKPK